MRLFLQFWYRVLLSHPMIRGVITAEDQLIFRHLTDLYIADLDESDKTGKEVDSFQASSRCTLETALVAVVATAPQDHSNRGNAVVSFDPPHNDCSADPGCMPHLACRSSFPLQKTRTSRMRNS